MKVVRRNQIRLLLAEKGRGTTQNHRAETEIREIKTKWKTRMRENQVPSRLWDYGLVYISEIQSLLARGPDQRPGIEKILGQTVDISEWLDFDFYDRVWYWDHHKTDMNNEQARIGRWLGIAHRVGSDMTYWILTRAGHVIARRRSFEADAADDDIPPDAEYGDMNQPAKRDADDIEFDSFDQYLNSEFLVNNDGETAMARVVKRARDNNGNPIGKRHPNPLLDTREYECELEDGSLMRYHANVIAENIFAQCDDEGRRHAVLAEIVDHKADKRALRTDNGYVTTKRGRRVPKKTTKGWKILCQWKDGSTDWVDMRYVKDSNPIELAEYAVANRIQEEPAFKWWVSETLRMRNRIIGKVKSRYWKTSHKYGVRLPHSVQEALQIDKETGTDFWWNAIQKELKKVMVAFEYDESVTPEQIREGLAKGKYVGFQEIKCHMIFDVKMDLTRKARFVAGGHMTEPPASITYSSVVSRDSVRIAFMLAALNDLDVLACDIGNAYLNAPCREKVWFVAGPEFGSRQGTVIRIVRALYGLKSSGASWRAMFNNSIRDMGFQPSIADPDVYLRAFAKPNGYKYYEYILVYVDDVLIISHAPEEHLKIIQANYELNPASIGPPNRYLGADVEKVQKPGDPTGREYWSFSARTYVKNAVKNVKLLLQEEGRGLKSTAKTPFPSSSYRPEVDTTDECNSEQATRFQNLIGVLRWAVELGRLDVYTEVALLSQHLALPRLVTSRLCTMCLHTWRNTRHRVLSSTHLTRYPMIRHTIVLIGQRFTRTLRKNYRRRCRNPG
ncbi:Reverse transcriptase (RNA-dependent DNA polymerase) [Fragilaria crotonensis]|nr:Reverse transcriptase (RNA-dependent DNA polymerase) [Fragilaria crotonensis]